jgi:predicted amino acid-binding ACT domain protein
MLPINIDQVLSTMKRILLTVFNQDKPAVVAAVDGYIADSKERLSNLAVGAISGELSFKFVTERLKEETVNLKDQMLSVGEIIASDLQEVINKAVDIYEGAIKNAIDEQAS